MKLQTHINLALKEYITNWEYLDYMAFLVILLIFTGFNDPCDRCMINDPLRGGLISCKDNFIQTYIDEPNLDELNLTLSNINYSDTYNFKPINSLP